MDGIASLGQVLPEPPRTANGRGARSNDVGVTRGAKQRDTQRPLGPEARLAVPRENIQLLLPDAVNPSKDQLAAYWTAVAGDALPYLARRPLKLVLHRRGVTYFHQGPLPPTPPSVHQLEITKRGGERGIRLWVDDLAGLLGLAEMGAVEVHPWGARIEDIEHPDTMVFDFDPGDGVEWAFVTDTALRVRDLLKADGFAPWPKLTGGKGLHVVVPVAPDLGWTEVRAYSRQIAERAAATAPNRYTLSAKEDRTGRLYLDDMRNVRGIAAVGPYSPRARPGFPVAKPVTWRNVERGIPPDALTMEMLIEKPGRTRTRRNGRTR